MNSDYLLLIAASIFSFTYFISTIQMLIKLCGSMPGNIAVSHNFNSFVLLINKVLVSCAMLLFALSADMTFNQINFAYCLIWFGAFTTLLHIYILTFPVAIMRIISILLVFYGNNQNKGIYFDEGFKFREFAVIPSVSMAFFLLGFTLPMLFINTFPEFRSTIIQSSTILNGIGSILSVTMVEKRLATYIDRGDIKDAVNYVNIVVSSRLLTSAIVTLMFTLIVMFEML